MLSAAAIYFATMQESSGNMSWQCI